MHVCVCVCARVCVCVCVVWRVVVCVLTWGLDIASKRVKVIRTSLGVT